MELNIFVMVLLCACTFLTLASIASSSDVYNDEGGYVYGNELRDFSWGSGDLRLAESEDFISDDVVAGRLEAYFEWFYGSGNANTEGEWGTVCGLSFGMTEASVACRQLGYLTALSWEFAIDTQFGIANESAPIWLSGLKCSQPMQLHTLRCKYTGLGMTSYCQHIHDVAIYCSKERLWSNPYEGQVRLVEGINTTVSQGRVELYQNGQWGTICGKYFSKPAADSVCRQLGYTSAGLVQPATDPGSGAIMVEEITCENSQACFTSCIVPHKASGSCDHSQDVEVRCVFDIAEGSLYSAGSSSQCSIKGLEIVFAVMVGVIVLTGVAVLGMVSVVGLLIARQCRNKYSSRYYEELH